MDLQADVAIVGFGPGGAALASLLGRFGHRVVVLEKFDAPYLLPRMSTLDGEIARLLQHAGDTATALRHAIPQREVELFGSHGQRVGRLDWSHDHSGHPSHLSVHQPDIEASMAARIGTYPCVDVRWGHEVTQFTELPGGGFEVVARGPASCDESVRARYLVGMDGANSSVRTALGIGVDVLHEHQDRWVLTDFDVLGELPHGLGHRSYVDMTLGAPYFYGPNGSGRCRTDIRLRTDEPDEIVDDHDAAYALLEDRVGIPRDLVRITRRVGYRFRSQVAQALRMGDAFIGGDAAHAMPPFLGQGAATAMRDSANLAWKLHLALSGLAGVHVLDSYQAERLEHGASYVHGSLGTLLMSTVDDPQEAADRDEFIVAEGAVTFEADPLPDGILRRDAAGAPAKGAGTLAPQGRTRAEGRSVLVDDVVGYGFQLVATRPVADQLGPERLARLDALGVVRLAIGVSDQGAAPITDEGGTYAGWFAEHDAAAFLARPDFYLFGLAGDARQTVALVDDLLEQLAVGHHHGKGG